MQCPICDASNNEKGFIKTYSSPFNNQEYKLYHCANCNLEFWSPLKIIPEFYEKSEFYSLRRLGLSREGIPAQKHFFKNFPFKKGKLLDIGCGDGAFLKKARQVGFETYGIDFDGKSIEIARNKFGLSNTYSMSLNEFIGFAQERNLRFDVITFFEVLEHQDNPGEFMQHVKGLLSNEGYIAGSVPNRERPLIDCERRRGTIQWDYPPHHFLYLSMTTLQKFFEREGFGNSGFYPVGEGLAHLSAHLEHLFLGEITGKIKSCLRERLLKGRQGGVIINNETAPSKNDSGIGIFGPKLLKMLTVFRNSLFSPVALFAMPLYKKRGFTIYFQAKHG